MSAPPASEEAWQTFLNNYKEEESSSDDDTEESVNPDQVYIDDISQDKIVVQGTHEVIPATAVEVSFNNIPLTRVLREHQLFQL